MLNQDVINEVIKDLYDFPENKISSLMDYIAFLKKERIRKEKSSRKKRLMSFAGILSESEAGELLEVIQNNRVDKKLEITL